MAFEAEAFTQESVAGRTLETEFFEDTERPSVLIQNRYRKANDDGNRFNQSEKCNK